MSSKYREILVTEMPETPLVGGWEGGYLVRYSCGHITRRFPILPDDPDNVYVDYSTGVQYYSQRAQEKYKSTWKALERRYGNPKKPCPLCCESAIREEFPEMFRIIDKQENFHRGEKNSLSRVKYNKGYVGLADNAVRLKFLLEGPHLLSSQYALVRNASLAYDNWGAFGWRISTYDLRWLNNLDSLQEIYRAFKHNTTASHVMTVVRAEVLTRLSPDLYSIISGCLQDMPAESIVKSCAVSVGRFIKVQQTFSKKFIYGQDYLSLGIVNYLLYLLEEDVLDPALHLSGPLSGLALAKFSGIWPQVKQELEDLDFDPKGASL